MNIIPPIPSSSIVKLELIPDIAKTWKVGQVLNATAESSVSAQDKILLRIGQTFLETKTPIALKAGDQLSLLVKSLGTTPVFTLQTAPKATNVAVQNLKSFIAQQQDLGGC